MRATSELRSKPKTLCVIRGKERKRKEKVFSSSKKSLHQDHRVKP